MPLMQKKAQNTNHITELKNKKRTRIIALKFIIIIIIIFIIIIFPKDLIFRKGKKRITEKIKLLKLITNNDENEYRDIQNCLENDPDELECVYHLLNTKEVVGKKRILVGLKKDGCYVLLDDFEGTKICYSIGISNNIQFDEDLAKRGIDIYMYDHTIDGLPSYNERFHWKKIGLCGNNKTNPQLKTLEDLIKENGHTSEKNMILKLDIEFFEWESLIDVEEETLNQFKYIAIEYHFIKPLAYKLYYQVLKKLHKTHQVFYVRCNSYAKVNFGNNRICMILEVSYIIRKGNIFKKDETIWPIHEFDYTRVPSERSKFNLNLLRLFD